MPKVSIIIPTYKRSHFLKLTLHSIAQQTFQDFEVLVIDDGSPGDENQKLCAAFDKVQYFKIENSGGPAKPRNVGIRNATGEYIAFLDDDDLWMPHKLETQVAILEQNKEFGLIHGCCEEIDEKGNLLNTITGRPGKANQKHGDVKLKLIGNWTVMMPTSLVRKKIVDNVGLFNEEMPPAGEDMEFWARCSFETEFYYLDTPLVQYRVHTNNISGDKEKYIVLPLYLKKIIEHQLAKQHITNEQYQLLLDNLCKMQIKTGKSGVLKTVRNLFRLDLYWMFKWNNCKMLIYILFFKK